jgi:hypothetical protein
MTRASNERASASPESHPTWTSLQDMLPSPSPFAYIGRILSSSPTTAPSDTKDKEDEDEFQEDGPRQTIDYEVENKTERCARPLECPMCRLRLNTPGMVSLDFENCPRQSHVLQLSRLQVRPNQLPNPLFGPSGVFGGRSTSDLTSFADRSKPPPHGSHFLP